MATFMNIAEIKHLYPNEWVLLGDPEIDNTTVLGGFVVFHSENKKDLLKGKDLLTSFKLSTWTYTGEFPADRKLWLGLYRSTQ
jgi:hypothetical protein